MPQQQHGLPAQGLPALLPLPEKASAAARHLSTLTTVRPLAVRAGANFQVTRTSNLEAALGYRAGAQSLQPCTRCSKGRGVFPSCVVVADRFGGSCASCHYGNEGSNCSFRCK